MVRRGVGERDDEWLANRKRWASEVNDLRKVWKAEFDARQAERDAQIEAERQSVASAKAERKAERALARSARAGASAASLEEAKRYKDRRLRIVAGRRWQREHAMSLRRQAREVDLLKQSRAWIDTEEALEERIQRALANPERLYK